MYAARQTLPAVSSTILRLNGLSLMKAHDVAARAFTDSP